MPWVSILLVTVPSSIFPRSVGSSMDSHSHQYRRCRRCYCPCCYYCIRCHEINGQKQRWCVVVLVVFVVFGTVVLAVVVANVGMMMMVLRLALAV